MKKIILLILILGSRIANAQTPCVQVDCKDTIQLPTDTVSLNSLITGAYKTSLWSQVGGTASAIDNPTALTTVARGLKPGLYVFQMKVTNGNSATIGMDSIVVLPAPCPVCPPPVICPVVDSIGIGKAYMAAHPITPRSFVSVTVSNGVATVLYNDGTTDKIILKNSVVIQ